MKINDPAFPREGKKSSKNGKKKHRILENPKYSTVEKPLCYQNDLNS
jgi:hypothetical protein